MTTEQTTTDPKSGDGRVKAQLDAVAGWGREKLREKYRAIFDLDPGAFPDYFLAWRICHHLQVLAFGGLTVAEQDILDKLGRKESRAAPAARPAPAAEPLVQNVVYERVYKGRTYRLEVLGDHRYACGGHIFRSPTAAAEFITGTHTSGKSFFGLAR